MAVLIKPVSEKENGAPTSPLCGETVHIRFEFELPWTSLSELFLVLVYLSLILQLSVLPVVTF